MDFALSARVCFVDDCETQTQSRIIRVLDDVESEGPSLRLDWRGQVHDEDEDGDDYDRHLRRL